MPFLSPNQQRQSTEGTKKTQKKTTQQNNANAALANGLFEMNLILCSFLRPPKKTTYGDK